MAKLVFKPYEIQNVSDVNFVEIDKPDLEFFEKKTQDRQEEFSDSDLENLNQKISHLEEKRQILEREIQEKAEFLEGEIKQRESEILEEAKKKAESIIGEAELEANRLIDEQNEKNKKLEEAIKLKEEQLIKDHKNVLEKEKVKARDKAREEGFKSAYEEGEREIKFIVEKFQSMVSKIIEKRKEILEESEKQIINLVLQITTKVVKTITEKQKGIVIENVKDALNKIKEKTKLVIRVNLEDLDIVRQKKEDFLSKFDKISNIEVLEDISISKGGCLIETDFGEIDAKISSQLEKIEEKIKDFSAIGNSSY